MQKSTYAQAVPTILAEMEQEEAENAQPEEYDIYLEPDRVTIMKKGSEGHDPGHEETVIDSVQSPAKGSKQPYVSFILSSLLLFPLLFLPSSTASSSILTTTITLFEKANTISLANTLQFGRTLDPITVTQSKGAAATGHGHQEATRATGLLTFYNGLFAPQTIAEGTEYTSTDGIQVVTNETVKIPASNPPYVGEATVTAQAVTAASGGNIHAGDISITTTTLLVRSSAFSGGQDERYFSTVSPQDIHKISTQLLAPLTQSMQAALAGQVETDESLQMLPCMPRTTSDHQVGEEATEVTVTVSLTCSGVAYGRKTLQTAVTQFQNSQALKQLGAGYRLLGDLQVKILATTVAPHNTCFLRITSTGTWVYAVTSPVQQRIKALVMGKSKQAALQILRNLPGIERATLSGVDNTTPIPNDASSIHILVVIGRLV